MLSNGSDSRNAAGRTEHLNVKFKHLACVVCRKRKLRCNGERPTCDSCVRSGRNCEYEGTARKTGPRRGYVKSLEARLAEIESRFENPEESIDATNDAQSQSPDQQQQDQHAPEQGLDDEMWQTSSLLDPAISGHLVDSDMLQFDNAYASTSSHSGDFGHALPPEIPQSTYLASSSEGTSWELHAMGLEEPLPDRETIDALHHIFFEKIYPSVPILHSGRYLSAMSLPATSRLRPPVCLSYIIWCLAASADESYAAVAEHFYARARKYAERDELKDRGQHVITLAHVQATMYLSVHESKSMYFPRTWLTTGKAVRLCHMMGLHRLDGVGLDVRETLPSPTNWTELEERRRTFWAIFVQDRYASIGSGWPTIIDERDISSNLPSSEEGFASGQPSSSMSLAEAMTPAGAKHLSIFAASVVVASIFGRTLVHLHRPDPDDGDGSDLNSAFWRRHRQMDNVLLNIMQYLPTHLTLRFGMTNGNVVQLHMNIHASTICLHQAAVFKAGNSLQLKDIKSESRARCLLAAESMMKILRLVSPQALSAAGAFISFCLYLAARVFVQLLTENDRSDKKDFLESLQFLTGFMQGLKQKSPYTISLLLQLETDLASLGGLNPTGHVTVPIDRITESLEESKIPDEAYRRSAVPQSTLGKPSFAAMQGHGAELPTFQRTHSDSEVYRNGGDGNGNDWQINR